MEESGGRGAGARPLWKEAPRRSGKTGDVEKGKGQAAITRSLPRKKRMF